MGVTSDTFELSSFMKNSSFMIVTHKRDIELVLNGIEYLLNNSNELVAKIPHEEEVKNWIKELKLTNIRMAETKAEKEVREEKEEKQR